MKVLFVDDEEFFRMMVREMLRARAPDVSLLEAGDGGAALEVLRAERVDCVVSDLVMPRKDGLGLLLGMLNGRLCAPMVFMSAHAGEVTRTPGLPRWLPKPVDLGALCAVLAELHVDRSAAHDARPTLSGLIQVAAWERRTCRLRAVWRSERNATMRGALDLVRGHVVSAVAESSAARLDGADAAVRILAADPEDVQLEAVRVDDPSSASDALDLPLSQLLARADALRRLQRANAPSGGEVRHEARGCEHER